MIDRWGVLPLPFGFRDDLPGDLDPTGTVETDGSKMQEATVESFRFSYTVNSMGFRGLEVDISDSTSVIMITGDGFGFGTAVDGDRTISDELNREMGRRFGQGRFASVNASLPGYSILDQYDYMEEKGQRLKPALLVIVQAKEDDFWEIARPVKMRSLWKCLAWSPLCIPRFMYHRVVLDVFHMKDVLLEETGRDEAELESEMFGRYLEALERMSRLVDGWGGRVLVLTESVRFPDYRSALGRLGIPLLVLEEGDPGREGIVLEIDGHWSAGTHRLATGMLADWIEEHMGEIGPDRGEKEDAARPPLFDAEIFHIVSPERLESEQNPGTDIDEKSDLIRETGCVRLHRHSYTGIMEPELRMEAIVFEMETPEMAAALLEIRKAPEAVRHDLTGHAYHAKDGIFFTHGSLYVEATVAAGEGKMGPDLAEFGRMFVGIVGAAGDGSEKSWFPKKGMVDDGPMLIISSALGLEWFDRVYTAHYRRDGGEATAFVANGADPGEAVARMSRYHSFMLDQGGTDVSTSLTVPGVRVTNTLGTYSATFTQGLTFAGVHMSDSLSLARSLVAELYRELNSL